MGAREQFEKFLKDNYLELAPHAEIRCNESAVYVFDHHGGCISDDDYVMYFEQYGREDGEVYHFEVHPDGGLRVAYLGEDVNEMLEAVGAMERPVIVCRNEVPEPAYVEGLNKAFFTVRDGVIEEEDLTWTEEEARLVGNALLNAANIARAQKNAMARRK